MKKIFFILLIMFSVKVSFGQETIAAYGKIDKADLEMKDCDFDKGAAALKLIDYGKMIFENGTVYEYRVRIKILKEKGLSYANVEIPFYSLNDYEKNYNIVGCTYNLNESGQIKVTEVANNSIYIKKIDKRISRLIIAFPEVKVGSVIEYKYRLERKTIFALKDWYFQDVIPTRYSEYEIKVPVLLKFKPQKFIDGNLLIKNSSFDDYYFEQIVKVEQTNYIMHDLIGIKKVPFMGAPKDYEQRIEFQITAIERTKDYTQYVNTNWGEIIKYFKEDEDFWPQMTKSINDLEPVINKALQINDIQKRIKYLYDTVRSRMICTYDEGFMADDGVNKAWQKKNGNIAEINMILINLLKKADIKASPILLSSRDNGLVNKVYYSERQFNKLMAYIPLDNGFMVLDATDKVSHYQLTPESIVNTSGFIIDGETGKWVDILDEKHKYQLLVALQAVVNENGIMKGECSINCTDYAKKERAEAYKKNSDLFKQDYFIKPFPNVTIEDISVKNEDIDSVPLTQKIIFNLPLSKSGEYSYFNTNMFNDFDKNPFVDDERNSDIDFGTLQEYLIYCNFTIPDGYVYETLPQNISMSLPDKSIQYTRIMNEANHVLNIRISIDFRTTFYPVSSYPDFHEFYKKMLNSLNEQVVIKKK